MSYPAESLPIVLLEDEPITVWQLVKYCSAVCLVVVLTLAFAFLLAAMDEKLSSSATTTTTPTTLPPSLISSETIPSPSTESTPKTTEVVPAPTTPTTTTTRGPQESDQGCTAFEDRCRIEHCEIQYRHEICSIFCTDYHGTLNPEYTTAEVIADLLDISGCIVFDLYFTNVSMSFEENWLDVDARVEILRFIDSPLDRLAPGAFNSSTFENISTLHLDSNTLVPDMNFSSFYGLSNAKSLIIEDSKMDLNELPTELSAVFTNLDEIKIRFKWDTMIDMRRLVQSYETVQRLDLSYNWIETVPRGVLDRLPNLVALKMFSSKVTTIESDAFSGTPKLLELDLGLNQIGTLPAGLLDEIVHRRGAMIHLFGSFVCDCSLHALQRLMDATKESFFSDEITCYYNNGYTTFEANQISCKTTRAPKATTTTTTTTKSTTTTAMTTRAGEEEEEDHIHGYPLAPPQIL